MKQAVKSNATQAFVSATFTVLQATQPEYPRILVQSVQSTLPFLRIGCAFGLPTAAGATNFVTQIDFVAFLNHSEIFREIVWIDSYIGAAQQIGDFSQGVWRTGGTSSNLTGGDPFFINTGSPTGTNGFFFKRSISCDKVALEIAKTNRPIGDTLGAFLKVVQCSENV